MFIDQAESTLEIRLSEVVSALSYALDLTEGQPEGHAVRTCLIGMRIAEEISLPAAQRSELFYALLLKDAGCSTNAAETHRLFGADDLAVKRNWKLVDWSSRWESFRHVVRNAAPRRPLVDRVLRVASFATAGSVGAELVRMRCERGAEIVQMLGFPAATADAIRTLDEHWDGHGVPNGLRGAQIPLLARVLCLAQTTEIFASAFDVETAYQVAAARAGRWFDPELVAALRSFRNDHVFWSRLYVGDAQAEIARVEPDDRAVPADDIAVDRIAEAFARVIDAKSPFTYAHSTGVAEISLAIGRILEFSADEQRDLRRAALLHDLGKLGVSNSILDKPGRLTREEMAAVRRHTEYTSRILHRVSCFRSIADIAAAHHERLDGTGYHLGLSASQIPLASRVIAVADVFEALSAERPYRDALSRERVLNIMQIQAGPGLCPTVFDALLIALDRGLCSEGDGVEVAGVSAAGV
jgi:putative nucleotidyltransferase with HDIG domain